MPRFPITVYGCLAALFLAGAWSDAHAHDPESRATYVGNAGILIEHGELKILFDAFYSQSFNNYLLVDKQTIEDMMAARPPYDGIDAVFVSHVHGDHFSPAPMLAYLRAQPDVQLYASSQVREVLSSELDDSDPVLQRVMAVNLTPGEDAMQYVLDGIEIDVVAIPHSGGARMADIMNLAFRVSLDDSVVIIHLGDASHDRQVYEPLKAHFSAPRIDTAFPPYWFVGDEDGEYILDEILKPAQVIGVHVPARAAGEGDLWRSRAGDDLFTDPGDSRKLVTHPE